MTMNQKKERKYDRKRVVVFQNGILLLKNDIKTCIERKRLTYRQINRERESEYD